MTNKNFYTFRVLNYLPSSNHKNPHINIFFQDVFPISLTELTFDVTQPDLEYLEASVTFRYRKFKTERI